MTSPAHKKRLDYVDGLRGLAAMLVVVAHWLEHSVKNDLFAVAPADQSPYLLLSFYLGRIGVVAFFCISGFVVPFSFRTETGVRGFVISRFFRLYPAYWLSLAAALLVYPLIGSAVTAPQALANVTMIQTVLRQPDVIGVYWTLFVEIIFYATCTLLFVSHRLHRPGTQLAMVIVFLMVGLAGALFRYTHPASGLAIGLPTYLAAMHFGTIARLRFLEGAPISARRFAAIAAGLMALVFAINTLGYVASDDKGATWLASSLAYAIGLSAFLLCIRFHLFGGAVLAYLGAISFAVYLFHPLVIRTICPPLASVVSLPALVPVSLLLVFVTVSIVAAIVYRLVEQPAVALGRRLIKGRALQRAIA
ncbi:acyltransferase [Sphingomonas sp. BK235]|uniref:acyltransferase family protein n=1 Tax=Sphingomonas sp. BK235 TaxID=2512131 RepID=UPI001049C87E|nr:acyltransferase [Sphingomonas sp. BK235]TCP34081.1 peptidoglycan/LPS O-acetylase OafA/YrhL [Sphingomonas sp. BK235]